MKKIFLFLLLQSFVAITYAFETNEVFGMKEQSSVEGYQQYVGKDFFIREAIGMLETWNKSGFSYDSSDENKIYTVTKVIGKEVELNKKQNIEITVQAVEKGTKNKIKFKGYQEVSVKLGFWGNVKKWPLIGYMPIVFVEPYEEYKNKHMGEIITHDIVKDQYEIIDVFIGKSASLKESETIAAPNVKVKNMRNGEIVSCPYSQVKIDPFASALTGKYKLALAKVEKPEDQTERYGETTTIQDDGLDKYSYKDEIIDILIFGTKTQFNFTLKNVSDHSIKLIWNEAAFVGIDGNTSKIMHVGIKYADRKKDQPATTIIKGAKIEDIAQPIANVYYDEGTLIGYSRVGSGWKTNPMLPEKYVGKEAGEIRLMLPFQIKDVVNEYTFVFKVYYTYDHPELLNTEKL